MRRCTVLHVVKSLGRGGAERVVFDIATRARDDRLVHEVLVVNETPDGMREQFLDAGVTLHELRCRGIVGLTRVPASVARVAKASAPAVLHDHFPLTAAIGRLAFVGSDVARIYTEHSVPQSYHRWTRVAHRATLWRVDHVVAVSDEVRTAIEAHLGRTANVTVISNGVDTAWFTSRAPRALARERLGMEGASHVVGVVANLRAEKRLDRWLDVARLVHERVPGTRFIIVGDGPERACLEALTASLGLDRVVTFAGEQRDPRPWYEAMDVFMLTSDVEGFGLVVAEAMAMGVLPVVTDVGPLRSMVPDGAGFVVERDVAALGEAAIRALVSREAGIGLESLRETAVERFDVAAMVGAYEALYRSLCC